MALEIERKFLITKLPANLESYPHADIVQGYFFNEAEQLVRIRRKGNSYFQTTKSGQGMTRQEYEEALTQALFEEERNNVGNRFLQKTRYEIPYASSIIELDIYRGKLEGLVVVEIEFTSEKEANAFIVPDRLGKELTGIPEAENAYLAKYGKFDAFME